MSGFRGVLGGPRGSVGGCYENLSAQLSKVKIDEGATRSVNYSDAREGEDRFCAGGNNGGSFLPRIEVERKIEDEALHVTLGCDASKRGWIAPSSGIFAHNFFEFEIPSRPPPDNPTTTTTIARSVYNDITISIPLPIASSIYCTQPESAGCWKA